MIKSPEQFNAYSEEQAFEEARRMQEKISKGNVKDYNEAEMQIEKEDIESRSDNKKSESVILLENRPIDKEVVDPKTKDLPLTPEPMRWKNSKTNEILTAYPAICHDIHSRIYGIVDQWVIRWFDNADEAASVDAKARQEAELYKTARRIYAELTAEAAEAELPLKIPECLNELSPQEILSMAGFSEDQYHIRNDVGHWSMVGEKGYRSEGESWDGVLPSATLANKNEEGVWEIGTLGLSNMFESQSVYVKAFYVGENGGWVKPKSVLSEIGVPKEKIIFIKTQIETIKKKSEEEFNVGLKEFIKGLKGLKELSVFSCLPRSTQEKIEELNAPYQVNNLSSVVKELRKELGEAEKLHILQEQGEILVNWGGHFRQTGRKGNAQYWVVRPDGLERYPDEVKYRKGSTSEGEKFWRVVDRDELAISWSKGSSSAPHTFKVNHLPIGKMTNDQLAIVNKLEEKIANEWKDARGISSGSPSPSIGDGWGITGKKIKTKSSISVFKTEDKSIGTAMEEAMRKAGFIKKDQF